MTLWLVCDWKFPIGNRSWDNFLASTLMGSLIVPDLVSVRSPDNERRFAFQKSLVWRSNIGGIFVSRMSDLRRPISGSSLDAVRISFEPLIRRLQQGFV